TSYYILVLPHFFFFFFQCYGDHRDLHSFPTRRSSDLLRSRISSMASKRLRESVLEPSSSAATTACRRRSTARSGSPIRVSSIACARTRRRPSRAPASLARVEALWTHSLAF